MEQEKKLNVTTAPENQKGKEKKTYLLGLQLLLEHGLARMQAAEAVDLLLVLAADLGVLGGGLVLFRELQIF